MLKAKSNKAKISQTELSHDKLTQERLKKAELRRKYRQLRSDFIDSLGGVGAKSYLDAFSQFTQFLVQILKNKSGIWASYKSTQYEIDPDDAIRQMTHIQWAYPIVQEGSIEFIIPQGVDSFLRSPWGIWEPDPSKGQVVEPRQLAGLLIPGVAFDRSGARLGMGKGYYDRALKDFVGMKLGLAFSVQVATQPLPLEEHDVCMDAIVTEKYVVQPPQTA